MEKKPSIGALWTKEKNGRKFMSGDIEIDGKKIKIVAFENSYKKEDKHPDFQIFESQQI